MQALLDLAACIALGFQYRPCVPQQDISLLGAAQSLSRSLEQLGSQLAFQIPYGFGYSGLRHVQALGGARHIFVFCYGGKLPKLI